jgi:hypothetical protein
VKEESEGKEVKGGSEGQDMKEGSGRKGRK